MSGWLRVVADFESSELTRRKFASERRVSFSSLRHRLYDLRKESRPLVTEAAEHSEQSPKQAPEKKVSRLVPIEVVASAANPRTRALVASQAG